MTDIFSTADQAVTDTNSKPADQAGTTNVNPIQANYQMIGADKKYKTVEEADKALFHAQEHIRKLEEEARKKDEALLKSSTIDEVIAKLDGRTQDVATQTTNVANTESALTPEKVKEIADKRYEERKAQELRESNVKAVNDQLLKIYGTPAKAREVLEKTALELNTSVETLRSLAMQSPNLALKALIPSGDNPPTSGFAPSSSPVINTPQEPYNAFKDDLKVKAKQMSGPELDKYLKQKYAHMNLNDGAY